MSLRLARAREERRARASTALLRRRAHREAHPLARARLWHAEGIDTSGEEPRLRTSQRLAVASIAGSVSTAVFGGNGVGKSEAAAQLAVACMLGRDHPDVRAWLEANHLPPELVPPYPGRVLVSSLTSDLSKKVARVKVGAYLPKIAGVEWRNRTGDGPAEVSIPALRPPGDANGACIVFKSNDQTERAYQSDEFDVVLNDEEHDEPVFEQELARLNRRRVPGWPMWRGGWIAHFMTLERGFSWSWQKHEEQPTDGYRVAWLHAPDSPWFDLPAALRRYAGLSEAKRRTKLYGTPASRQGSIYPMWDPRLHVIDPIALPPEWPRYRAIDFGTRAPFCCLWICRDPKTDTLYVYDEHYEAERTTTEHHGIIVGREVGHPAPVWTAADPESLDAIRTLQKLGMAGIRHPGWMKSILEGIDEVSDRLRPDAEGRPHLFVFRGKAPNLVREIARYRWQPGRSTREVPDPDCADHALDALRYAVRLVTRDLAMAA